MAEEMTEQCLRAGGAGYGPWAMAQTPRTGGGDASGGVVSLREKKEKIGCGVVVGSRSPSVVNFFHSQQVSKGESF